MYYILIHGACHAGWCWEKLVPLLEQAGHTVFAPDLPGHGNDHAPLHTLTPRSYAEHVLSLIDQQPGQVILVGHSMGGIVVSQCAESRPERIRCLVYVAAFLLRDGEAPGRDDGPESRFSQLMSVNDHGYFAARNPQPLFYHDCSPDDAKRASALLVPEPPLMLGALHITPERYGSVPRIYIECRQDRVIGLSKQREMYQRTPCQAIFSLDCGHSPFFARPRELVTCLHAAQFVGPVLSESRPRGQDREEGLHV